MLNVAIFHCNFTVVLSNTLVLISSVYGLFAFVELIGAELSSLNCWKAVYVCSVCAAAEAFNSPVQPPRVKTDSGKDPRLYRARTPVSHLIIFFSPFLSHLFFSYSTCALSTFLCLNNALSSHTEGDAILLICVPFAPPLTHLSLFLCGSLDLSVSSQ